MTGGEKKRKKTASDARVKKRRRETQSILHVPTLKRQDALRRGRRHRQREGWGVEQGRAMKKKRVAHNEEKGWPVERRNPGQKVME